MLQLWSTLTEKRILLKLRKKNYGLPASWFFLATWRVFLYFNHDSPYWIPTVRGTLLIATCKWLFSLNMMNDRSFFFRERKIPIIIRRYLPDHSETNPSFEVSESFFFFFFFFQKELTPFNFRIGLLTSSSLNNPSLLYLFTVDVLKEISPLSITFLERTRCKCYDRTPKQQRVFSTEVAVVSIVALATLCFDFFILHDYRWVFSSFLIFKLLGFLQFNFWRDSRTLCVTCSSRPFRPSYGYSFHLFSFRCLIGPLLLNFLSFFGPIY